MSKVTHEVMVVSPEQAKYWLENNNKVNRNLRIRGKMSIAADMSSGNWDYNGAPIRFDEDGNLQDGQHRLAGQVESWTTQTWLVIRGLPREAQDNMDTGRARSFPDTLKFRGEERAAQLAAVVRRVNVWEATGSADTSGMYTPTISQLSSTLEQYPELRWITQKVQVIRLVGIQGGTVGLTYWMFWQIEQDDCMDFFEKLETGANLNSKQHPIAQLRNIVSAAKMDRSRRIGQKTMTALIIKAWNLYRDGTEVKQLRWRSGGANPEPFPEPH